mmetsp:Transcript_19534/g.22728  ORF Transcript_19534/g.22728 Transcript_19534/m.22728 type:complete len:111 (-) Transcript_19534:3-335(-)
MTKNEHLSNQIVRYALLHFVETAKSLRSITMSFSKHKHAKDLFSSITKNRTLEKVIIHITFKKKDCTVLKEAISAFLKDNFYKDILIKITDSKGERVKEYTTKWFMNNEI